MKLFMHNQIIENDTRTKFVWKAITELPVIVKTIKLHQKLSDEKQTSMSVSQSVGIYFDKAIP